MIESIPTSESFLSHSSISAAILKDMAAHSPSMTALIPTLSVVNPQHQASRLFDS